MAALLGSGGSGHESGNPLGVGYISVTGLFDSPAAGLEGKEERTAVDVKARLGVFKKKPPKRKLKKTRKETPLHKIGDDKDMDTWADRYL